MRGGAATFALNGTHTSAVVRVNDSIQKLACVSMCVCTCGTAAFTSVGQDSVCWFTLVDALEAVLLLAVLQFYWEE